jgi:hypothetical protein
MILLYVIISGNTNRGGRLSTVDFLNKVACFVTKVISIFNIKGADVDKLV